ncbi:MAG: response regulator transcription factor [Rhodocyclaceae bacterium]|nr:MAG: response regulator transcription factor [Rhodocyclaceae bacterium]RTL56397.1 MAG: response regulator transcription factor [Rhodocyclaceae bacterium]
MIPGTTARPIRLLLVDDHPLVREGLKARLDAMAHLQVVGEAGSGEEALAMAERLKPDLVLVDISMKGMNGIEFTLRLGGSLPGMKTMVLSMYDKAEYVASAIRAGASGYVLKDTPVTGIIAAIETIAAGGSHFDPALMAALNEPAQDNEHPITGREREILLLLAQGLSNKRIAQQLDISVRTVETHRLSLRRKLGITTPAGFVKYAMDQGWMA